KYWVGTLPLLAVAIPLILLTNVILEVSPFVLWLTTATMVGVTLALTALALGFGALFPNYETENAAEIPTSFGGLLFMMAAVACLAVVGLLVAWPVDHLLREGLAGESATLPPLLPVAAGVGGAALLTALAIWVPLAAGVRRVRSADF